MATTTNTCITASASGRTVSLSWPSTSAPKHSTPALRFCHSGALMVFSVNAVKMLWHACPTASATAAAALYALSWMVRSPSSSASWSSS